MPGLRLWIFLFQCSIELACAPGFFAAADLSFYLHSLLDMSKQTNRLEWMSKGQAACH